MKLKTIILVGAIALAAMSTAACGKTVKAGEVGVKIKSFGGGVEGPLPQGWHGVGLGEHIDTYPTIQRTYTYTKPPEGSDALNEQVLFADNNALPMSADVQAVISIDPSKAVSVYNSYRLTFDELLAGPIRNDIRTAIAAETELVTVETLYTGGRQAVIQKALARVQKKWSPVGVHITQLDWIGTIRYPTVITESIQAKTKADADRTAAEARVAVAKAEADSKVETAKGEAESMRLRGDALRSNPEIVEQIYAERSQGLCPPKATTCILGQGAWGLVPK